MIDESELRDLLHDTATAQGSPPGLEQRIDRGVHRASRRGVVVRVAAAVLAIAAVSAAALSLRGSDDGERSSLADRRPSPVTPGWHDAGAVDLGARTQGLTLAMGEEVLAWGGFGTDDPAYDDGAVFSPRDGTWRAVPDAPLPRDRGDAIGAWTGREAIVLAGVDGDVRAAAFDPTSDTWRALPDPPLANAANAMNRAVWTGDELVVVGVADEGEGDVPGTTDVTYQLAVYDPATHRWREGAVDTGLPSFGDAVWNGTEVVAVGLDGASGTSTGTAVVRAYDPDADAWRTLPSEPLGSRSDPVVAWTGDRLFVGGGADVSGALRDAHLLDVSSGSWTAVADAPVPFRGNDRYGEVWTGAQVVTLRGDADGTDPDGAALPLMFDPASGRWETGPEAPAGALAYESGWAWTGREVAVIGMDPSGDDLGGSTYVPPGA